MPRLRGVLAGIVVLPLLVLAGCGGDGKQEPETVDLPDGLAAYVDQSRLLRSSRNAFLRLVDETDRTVTVTRAEITSPRFGTVTWSGEKSFPNQADLPFEVPPGRCGEGSDARVRLTYRVDDGPAQVSETTATDRYGALGLFLDRDCAQEVLAEAATLEVGEPRVVGSGRASVFELPVSLTPTGERDDVSFAGFEDTVLFRNTDRSIAADGGRAIPLGPGDPPVDLRLRLVPTRCDPHALAEDKVGTLIGVRTDAPELTSVASFFLPIGDEQRAALRAFFARHCGL